MRVGVLGAGQLGRMLALAGYPLGLRFVFFDPAQDACAAPLGEHIRAEYSDRGALAEFARKVDVVTTEFENVSADAMRVLSAHVPVFPPADAIATTQDRLDEKRLFQRLGIGTPEFAAVDAIDDLRAFAAGGACVVKTRRFGYDGKGQRRVGSAADVAPAWEHLGASALIAERWIAFDREVSIIAVRSRDGSVAFYPVSENEHRGGVLAVSRSCPGDAIQRRAEEHAGRILRELNYVGAMGVEFFQRGGDLLANEIAPRVHNTGHWTIEGAVTSQFENHLRAILGLPLGSTEARGHSVMINCLGKVPERAAILAIPGAHLHDYGKTPLPGRKVGHVTCNGHGADMVATCVEHVAALCV